VSVTASTLLCWRESLDSEASLLSLLARQLSKAVALLLATAWLTGNQPLVAQAVIAEVKAPTLEVVSVKPRSEVHFDPDNWGVTADGLTVNGQLSFLIRSAFGAQFFEDGQILNEPSWCHEAIYEIAGKVSSEDVARLRNLNPQQRTQIGEAMMQSVLAERFKLQVHEESREGWILALVPAKNGARLKEARPGNTYSDGLKLPSGRTTGAGTLIMGRNRITVQALSLQDLASALSGPITGAVVVDKTGLAGKYDFTLTWTPDQLASHREADGNADAPGPSIFTAIQEQLGLKLQREKGPIKVLVIDHIERPSEN
jgi:uncharacterized protein (TIGR03435 family)